MDEGVHATLDSISRRILFNLNSRQSLLWSHCPVLRTRAREKSGSIGSLLLFGFQVAEESLEFSEALKVAIQLKLGLAIAHLEDGRWKNINGSMRQAIGQLGVMFETRFGELD